MSTLALLGDSVLLCAGRSLRVYIGLRARGHLSLRDPGNGLTSLAKPWLGWVITFDLLRVARDIVCCCSLAGNSS